MKLIIGLGNPGKEYEYTRHNVGFMIIDEFAKMHGVDKFNNKFKGLFAKINYAGESVLILKPQTFMNLSGESVRAIVDFYDLDIDDILVVYDDLDLELGKIRFKAKSSHGGHNGIKSIEKHLGTNVFKRLKFGIGRDENIPVVNYVIGKFKKEDSDILDSQIGVATRACEDFIQLDFLALASKYN